MITRSEFRGWLKWAGVGIGVAGAMIYLLTFFGTITRVGPHRWLAIGRGAVVIIWSEHAMRRGEEGQADSRGAS